MKFSKLVITCYIIISIYCENSINYLLNRINQSEIILSNSITNYNPKLIIRLSFPDEGYINSTLIDNNMSLYQIKSNAFIITMIKDEMQSYDLKYVIMLNKSFHIYNNGVYELMFVYELEYKNDQFLVISFPIVYGYENNFDRYLKDFIKGNSTVSFPINEFYNNIENKFYSYDDDNNFHYFVYHTPINISETNVNDISKLRVNEFISFKGQKDNIEFEKTTSKNKIYIESDAINKNFLDNKLKYESKADYLLDLDSFNSFLQNNKNLTDINYNKQLINIALDYYKSKSNTVIINNDDILNIFESIYNRYILPKLEIPSLLKKTHLKESNKEHIMNNTDLRKSETNSTDKIHNDINKFRDILDFKKSETNTTDRINNDLNKFRDIPDFSKSHFLKKDNIKYYNGSIILEQTIMVNFHNNSNNDLLYKFNF